ncbi:MAG: S16 family serine protease [Candidatus Izemoplasmatales bacterium]
MNELTNRAWPVVRILLVPYLLFMFLLFYPIDYEIDAPGGITEVSRTIEIAYNQDKVIEGSISTTYIMAIPRTTFFMFITGYFNPYVTISKLSTGNASYTNDELRQISYLDKETSVDASIIVAYQAASLVNPEVEIGYVSKILVFGKAEYLSHYDEIEFGDEFVQVLGDDGAIVTDIAGIAAATALLDAYDFTFKNADGEDYTLTLAKDTATGKFGVTLKTYHLVDREATYPLYENPQSNIGGPSGGLLQTLYVYNILVTEDVTRGLKIAGTGTIGYDGSAGYIGGVRQKILTAWFAGVDVFFIPHLDDGYYNDNYVEALRVCEDVGIDPEGWLIGVASFQDVLDRLAERGE